MIIFDDHYRSLSYLPPATNEVRKVENATYDVTECHLHSLEAIGNDVNHCHFVALISVKFPQNALSQLHIYVKETVQNGQ